MFYDKLKKGLVSLAIVGAFILSLGVGASAAGQINGIYPVQRRVYERGRDWDRWREREELERIRRLDRGRQLRYRYNNSIRVVGYYDRFGRFHAYGFYDRAGRFHRY